jgi:acyl carrier protein
MQSTVHQPGSPRSDVMDAIAETIRSVSSKARAATITSQSLLLEDLALDSLDMVAVVLRLQDAYEVEIDPDEITSLRSVGDLAASLSRQVRTAA